MKAEITREIPRIDGGQFRGHGASIHGINNGSTGRGPRRSRHRMQRDRSGAGQVGQAGLEPRLAVQRPASRPIGLENAFGYDRVQRFRYHGISHGGADD